jgi:phage gp45-like
MNPNDLFAVIRTVIVNMLSDIRLPQKGIVTSYDPTKHMAKVMLQPQNLETSWIQIASMGVGQGFGWTCGLVPGNEVMVAFEGGDINSGVITGCLYNGQDLPTLTNSGEAKFIHPTGSYIKFFADGSVEISAITSLSLMSPLIKLAAGAMTTSVAGLNISNSLTAQSFGPTATIPGGPTFVPALHAATGTPHPDI